MRSPLRIPAAVAVGVLAIGLSAGCGAPAPEPAPAPVGHAAHGSGAPALWAVQSGPLGVVVTDGDGRLLYRSDADTAAPPTSRCTGACTQTWVPTLLPAGQQPELLGVDPTKVGQFVRPDGGVQLTLAGWPLYHNATDSPGLVDAGNSGKGGWSAITPTGGKAAIP